MYRAVRVEARREGGWNPIASDESEEEGKTEKRILPERHTGAASGWLGECTISKQRKPNRRVTKKERLEETKGYITTEKERERERECVCERVEYKGRELKHSGEGERVQGRGGGVEGKKRKKGKSKLQNDVFAMKRVD